jgi:hypothetical protein
MSALGHSRPGPAGHRSSRFRYTPKATVGRQNAIGRDGPKAVIGKRRDHRRIAAPYFSSANIEPVAIRYPSVPRPAMTAVATFET